jgi:hypothetical protein
MDHFAGLDVSVKDTSVCIVDDTGRIVREVKVASEPEALLVVLNNPAYHFKRIGLEAGPLSQWLFSGLAEAGLPVVCVETRHMQAVLKAQINKTDRNDARGIAQMMRVGLYRPVHVKTLRSQKLRMLREQAHRAAECDKSGADLPDSAAIVLAGVRNRLVVGSKPAHQPHHLNVTTGLALQSAARLDPIEIAVDVELQQDRRMIRRPARYLGFDPVKSKLGQGEFIDKYINPANRIVLADPVFQAFREQRALTAIRPFNEAPHLILPQIARESYRENQIQRCVFTQPGSIAS